MTWNFLILSLLFLIPGMLVYAVRPDLRTAIHRMSVCALPFALTERFFYPDYWEPRFLFDLADHIGFGLEDILFVVGLAAFTTTAYPAFFRKTYETQHVETGRVRVFRAVKILLLTFIGVGLVVALRIPMIYGSIVIMTIAFAGLCLIRHDLLVPGLLGGLVSLGIYTLLCWLFEWMLPGVFDLAWHTDQFLNLFIAGIPLEELLYGFTSGMIATVFYPFVFEIRYVSLKK
ncbi:MAG: hypothetical protein HQM11_11280 [SAR324 cluster bacterium]|nr:hypothetical protein [SAR324 cluster bacterium]